MIKDFIISIQNKMDINNVYRNNILDRYKDLKSSNKTDFNNNDLWKIFEWFCCIKLSEESLTNIKFREYDDIDPDFKEHNKMSRNDTGIDLCDLNDCIVQCKLRKDNLTWRDCSTFFASQNIFSLELNKTIIRWENLIIARNDDCKLSSNLAEKKDLFCDKTYNKTDLIQFCEDLLLNPPDYIEIHPRFKLREYQQESVDLIKSNKENIIICLPTGTGKNVVIIYSFEKDKKYLILVPKIILMYQLNDEIIKHKPYLRNKIQLIGDGNEKFNENKTITICVYNSVSIVKNYAHSFEKIFVDEAHHINKPEIYEDIDYTANDSESEEDIDKSSDNKKTDIDNKHESESESEQENSDESDTESNYSEEDYDSINKPYTRVIKSFLKYNNNVYLSATIDKTDNMLYYKQDIREMIDAGYLTDYTINIPIFSTTVDNVNICKHLIKNYRNIIIYCNSQKEGQQINELMNKIQENCSQYIDCNTSKKSRNEIINKYKKGELPFLVNVKILVEGFDSPITKGVCFLHLPNSKTTTIQIIGRALRLHPNKTFATIILPFSTNDDENNISDFMRVMAMNDIRIKKSYMNKKLGGYISIEKAKCDDNLDNNTESDKDIEFKYDLIYNSMGVLINRGEIWYENLNKSREYIIIHTKRPFSGSKNKEIKKLGNWIHHQRENYKNNKKSLKKENIDRRREWEKFIEEFKECFTSEEQFWYENLNNAREYITAHNKRPSSKSKDKETKKLGVWIYRQIHTYKNSKEGLRKENIDRRREWEKFIEEFKECFISEEQFWNECLNKVKEYITTHNKRPSSKSKDKEIKRIGKWICQQRENYKNSKDGLSEKFPERRTNWEKFMEKFKKYF